MEKFKCGSEMQSPGPSQISVLSWLDATALHTPTRLPPTPYHMNSEPPLASGWPPKQFSSCTWKVRWLSCGLPRAGREQSSRLHCVPSSTNLHVGRWFLHVTPSFAVNVSGGGGLIQLQGETPGDHHQEDWGPAGREHSSLFSFPSLASWFPFHTSSNLPVLPGFQVTGQNPLCCLVPGGLKRTHKLGNKEKNGQPGSQEQRKKKIWMEI